jgi:tetratricopeptide (TPR) repeat protein
MYRIFSTGILLFSLNILAGAQASQNVTPVSGDAPANAPTPLEVAQDLAARGRLDKALAQLDELAAQSPEPVGVERLKGIILYQKEKLSEAIEAFTKAAAEDPNDRESIEMHGVSLFRLGRAPEAVPFLEKAHAAVERANIDPEYVLGLCYADVQRYDDARHAFAAQYGFAPDSAEAYLLAGRLFLRRELPDEAARQTHKALELNSLLPMAHQLLGEVALAKGDMPVAIQELEAERKINPLNGAMYERLGDAYLRSGQYTNAQPALNRAVLLEPNSTGPYILMGETFLKLKQPIQALHYLDHAAKMDPSNYVTHNLLGQAYKATGQVAEANREFQMVVDIQHGQMPQATGK